MKRRGYFGIAFFEPKNELNIETAIRSAHCFGAKFIAVIGKRYKRQASDTMNTELHIPIYEYKDLDDFRKHVPMNCAFIGCEMDGEELTEDFVHPERCIYLFGGEDRNLPAEIKDRVKIRTHHCLNMSVAASIIMYDRSRFFTA